jgi:hypothetical protein
MANKSELLQQQDPELFGEINKYIDELKGEAQGDYDFVVKFLKRQYQMALGTDDKARAEFFTKVANQLEERVGRIPYDYELKTGREKEDMATYLKQKDMEDTRQRTQESEFNKQQDLAIKEEQKAVVEGANARGMLGSGIQQRQQTEVQEKRNTNIIDPQKSLFSYQQAIRDEKARVAQVQSDRNLADITTEARRGGQDEQYKYDYGSESAQRTLEKRLAALERERNSSIGEGLSMLTTATFPS